MSLTGLLLVINSSRGHQVVLKYPTSPLPLPQSRGDQVVPVNFVYDDSLPSSNAVAAAAGVDIDNKGATTAAISVATDKTSPDSTLDSTPAGILFSTPLAQTAPIDNSVTPVTPTDASTPADRQTSSSSAPLIDRYMGFSNRYLGDMLTPKATLCNQLFQLGVDCLTFIGHPTIVRRDDHSVVPPSTLPPSINSAVVASPSSGVNALTSVDMLRIDSPMSSPVPQSSPVSMFNLVMVVKNDYSARNDHLIHSIYENIVRRVTMALEHAELSCNYVSAQSELILGIVDELSADVDEEQRHLTILGHSSLACELVDMFDQLVESDTCSLSINGGVPVGLSLSTTSGPEDSSEMVEPYQSLLLLYDADVILEKLHGHNCSQAQLKAFLAIVSWQQSLDQMRRSLVWPWERIAKMCMYLRNWGMAKLITPINSDSKFSATTFGGDDNKWKRKLRQCLDAWQEFGFSVNLMQIYCKLSAGIRVSSVAKSDDMRNNVLNAAAFLMRYSLLEQTSSYLLLQSFAAGSAKTSLINPNSLSSDAYKELADALLHVDRHHFDEVLKMIPYCDGLSSLDEISWCEGISRKKIDHIISIYKDYLMVLSYPSKH